MSESLAAAGSRRSNIGFWALIALGVGAVIAAIGSFVGWWDWEVLLWGVALWLALIVSIALYFLPTAIAVKRKHRSTGAIVALNVSGGLVVHWLADRAGLVAIEHPAAGRGAAVRGAAAGAVSGWGCRQWTPLEWPIMAGGPVSQCLRRHARRPKQRHALGHEPRACLECAARDSNPEPAGSNLGVRTGSPMATHLTESTW